MGNGQNFKTRGRGEGGGKWGASKLRSRPFCSGCNWHCLRMEANRGSFGVGVFFFIVSFSEQTTEDREEREREREEAQKKKGRNR